MSELEPIRAELNHPNALNDQLFGVPPTDIWGPELWKQVANELGVQHLDSGYLYLDKGALWYRVITKRAGAVELQRGFTSRKVMLGDYRYLIDNSPDESYFQISNKKRSGRVITFHTPPTFMRVFIDDKEPYSMIMEPYLRAMTANRDDALAEAENQLRELKARIDYLRSPTDYIPVDID